MIDKIMQLLIVIIILCIPLSIFYGCKEQAKWEQFKIEHNCKIVGKNSTQLMPIITSAGTVSIGGISSTVSWLCDDGVTYTR